MRVGERQTGREIRMNFPKRKDNAGYRQDQERNERIETDGVMEIEKDAFRAAVPFDRQTRF